MARSKVGIGSIAVILSILVLMVVIAVPRKYRGVAALLAISGSLITYAVIVSNRKKKNPQAIPTVSTNRNNPRAAMEHDDPIFRVTVGHEQKGYSIGDSPYPTGSIRWYGKDEAVNVAGRSITGGLIYVGAPMSSGYYGGLDATLIDPSKPVMESGDYTISNLTDYPSYRHADSSDRASYLEWLVSGRRDPNAHIGYILLFFQGLERRILLDSKNDETARNEWPVLEQELRDLLSIYGQSSGFFRSHARDLLVWMSLDGRNLNDLDLDLNSIEWCFESPIQLRIQLGRAVASGKPLTPELAYQWVRLSPDASLSTPARRCADEFSALYRMRYEQQFKDGLVIKPNKTRIGYTYHPFSSDLAGKVQQRGIRELPDVTVLSAPIKKLAALAHDVQASLDPYSRYLGKHKEATSFIARILLPRELWKERELEELAVLKRICPVSAVPIKYTAFLELIGVSGPVAKDRFVTLSKVLLKEGVGVEPDVVGGAKLPKDGDAVVVLFPAPPSDTQTGNSTRYSTALLIIQLSSAVMGADSVHDAAEGLHLDAMIDSWTYLMPAERSRLKAHLVLTRHRPVSMVSMKKAIEGIDMPTRERIGAMMAVVAQSDGAVTPSEITMLERVYKVLGIDPGKVFQDVHAAGTGGAASLARRREETGFNLDLGKIATLQRESEVASTILAQIFTENDEATDSDFNVNTQDSDSEDESMAEVTPSTILGLDALHASMARLLLTRSEWSRGDLEDMASDLEVMLDGSLEVINEAAYTTLDMPFVEEGPNGYVVNPDVYDKVKS